MNIRNTPIGSGASFLEVQDILFNTWDPIGVNENQNLRDEYDRYVPRVVRLLRMDASIQEIVYELLQIEEALSCKTSMDIRLNVARALFELRQRHR